MATDPSRERALLRKMSSECATQTRNSTHRSHSTTRPTLVAVSPTLEGRGAQQVKVTKENSQRTHMHLSPCSSNKRDLPLSIISISLQSAMGLITTSIRVWSPRIVLLTSTTRINRVVSSKTQVSDLASTAATYQRVVNYDSAWVEPSLPSRTDQERKIHLTMDLAQISIGTQSSLQ